MEEGDDGGAVTHCGATRALARKHTHYQRRRPRPAGVTHERHGRDLDLVVGIPSTYMYVCIVIRVSSNNIQMYVIILNLHTCKLILLTAGNSVVCHCPYYL